MTSDEIKQVVREALKDHHNEFYIPNERHYLDHKHMEQCIKFREEWTKNHEFISDIRNSREERSDNHKFISDVRASGKKVRTTSLIIIVSSVLGWIITTLFKGG